MTGLFVDALCGMSKQFCLRRPSVKPYQEIAHFSAPEVFCATSVLRFTFFPSSRSLLMAL